MVDQILQVVGNLTSVFWVCIIFLAKWSSDKRRVYNKSCSEN